MIQILDSGLQSGLANNAIDRYYLGLHARGGCSDRLRFYRNQPCVSIGRHQIIDREVRIDYCRDKNIGLVRRVSGGGAVYQDEQQLAWSLIVHRPRVMNIEQMLELFASELAAGLKSLGMDAHCKYPNDLEIDGRKLATLFMASEQESILLHGILLLDADIGTMLEALRVPTEKLSRDGLSAARERLITVKECLGELPELNSIQLALTTGLATALGRRFSQETDHLRINSVLCNPLVDERDVAYRLDWHEEEDFALEALWKTKGGTLRARAGIDRVENRFEWVEIGGDIHIAPADWTERLQDALKDTIVAEMQRHARNFFQANPADMLGFTPEDIMRLLQMLPEKLSLHHAGQLSSRQLNSLMIYSPDETGTTAILKEASVMLVPYCAKPVWCEWRLRDDCPECGLCEVGDAYRIGRERGMQITTVTHY
ncbi:MAG TPA: DUF116 domain-containing protein, partial [Burkholderiales bacterium]|nr:DUF116 domain-containing protein [Burkholderiales bacterium]